MAAPPAAPLAPEQATAGHCDAVLLAPLTEDTFLHNLHVRYKRDIIYTYVGEALVSLNPCRALPLYSPELVRAYLARPPHLLPPHLYGVTAAACRWVRDRGQSQAILITGESGAGKTEAARVCLQCCVLAGAGAGAGPVGECVVGAGGAAPPLTAAGTLLEAFGNAATARNHNASRFGAALEVELDWRGAVVSGHITHFLLEKERASGAGARGGERNFHVLYQLLAGAEPHLLKRLKLQRSWQQYRVLRGAGSAGAGAPAAAAAAQHDTQHFAFTKAAMAGLGLSAAECGGVLRVLAFLLKLGNLEFEPATTVEGALVPRLRRDAEPELRGACALLGVDAPALAAALGLADAPPPLDSDDDTDAELPADADEEPCGAWPAARRDRLLAAIYSRLFTWLVGAINERLRGAGGSVTRGSLVIVDVYGLESLAENGLERLAINYAAERVQAAAAGLLRRLQDEYAAEGLPYVPIALPDTDGAADLLDVGSDSVLGVLRECSARGGSDAALLARLQRRRHPRLAVLPPHHFQIVHFGGPVTYCARGMVSKNRDTVCARVAAVLARGAEPLLRALFPAAGGGVAASPRRAAPASIACRQRALVAALLRRLPPEPRLVRCLRPDAALRPRRFDAAALRHQLRTQGIVEMALVRRAGWCSSLEAREVVARYCVLAGRAAGAQSPRTSPAATVRDPHAVRAARALLRALPIPSAEFAYGRTKVFIRSPRTVWELEALRAARVERLVTVAQRAWRDHRRRARAAAQGVIARAWRRHRLRRSATGPGEPPAHSPQWAGVTVWRWWCGAARRRYLAALWARLPARHMSPACAAWPPCPYPALLGRTDALLRTLHHRWRCALYRRGVDQTQRNRMREKVTASALFCGRKALYARSVPHPFVGDYVRLRASAAWRRGAGAGAADRYVVFADVVRKVGRHGARESPALAVLSTRALLLLDPRSLRLKRRLPAHHVYRLSLSPHADDLLAVHVRAGGEAADWAAAGGEWAEWADGGGSSGDEAGSAAPAAAGCLLGETVRRRRGDVLLRSCHVLELATKLYLVVQNACAMPPLVEITPQFEVNLGDASVCVRVHAAGGGGGGGGGRLVRRGDRIDLLL